MLILFGFFLSSIKPKISHCEGEESVSFLVKDFTAKEPKCSKDDFLGGLREPAFKDEKIPAKDCGRTSSSLSNLLSWSLVIVLSNTRYYSSETIQQ